MGGISIGKLLILALIVVLLFGTNKLRTLGADLGASLKGFKKAMSDDEPQSADNQAKATEQQDADFAPRSLPEQSAESPKAEETKSQNKEQV